MVTDQPVVLLMAYLKNGRPLATAAAKAGMSQPTASKWKGRGELSSACRKPRTWRSRADRFEQHRADIAAFLVCDPGVQAKAVIEGLQVENPGQDGDGLLRTLQRRFRRWRLGIGAERQLFCEQEWQPGRQRESDFTYASSLGVTILGEAVLAPSAQLRAALIALGAGRASS